MGYHRLMSFRLGIRPSVRQQFDMNNLTGTQKLLLVQSRIFGTQFGGNLQNGRQELQRAPVGQRRFEQYQVPVHNPSQVFPFMQDQDLKEWKQQLVDGRKMRIMMRGVKIGRQKGGGRLSILNIYERKKAMMEATGEKEE
ncbi:hypothetical protein pb186bvf_007690 [Paramecium bursaria]